MFHVDHTTLVYLVEKHVLTRKLARWMLLLQQFEFTIQHRPRTQHVVADYLSKMDNSDDAIKQEEISPTLIFCGLRLQRQKTRRIFQTDG